MGSSSSSPVRLEQLESIPERIDNIEAAPAWISFITLGWKATRLALRRKIIEPSYANRRMRDARWLPRLLDLQMNLE